MKTSGGRPPTILIVEDIDWLRSSMMKSAERCGYRVVEASDDAEAIEVAARESPELILTEEQLPTFQALITRLREAPHFRHIPVVIVNPDAPAGARLETAFVLTDYDSIASLLISPCE